MERERRKRSFFWVDPFSKQVSHTQGIDEYDQGSMREYERYELKFRSLKNGRKVQLSTNYAISLYRKTSRFLTD